MPLQKSHPFDLFQLAKKYAWDPQAIELAQDRWDWAILNPREQDLLKNLLSMFVAGEEAVASDLCPLLWAVGRAGGLREEEMFLTSQLFDESLHVEFFSRWFEEVVVEPVDHSQYWGPSYRVLLFEAMPTALQAVLADHSPQAMARAYLAYHLTVEGVLAETGYHAAFLACQRRGILPGLVQGMAFIKRDESRHIAYGIHALQRILGEHPELMGFVIETMNDLLAITLGVIPEALAPYGDDVPFGINLAEMIEYASDQFSKRFTALERAAV